MCDLEKNLMNEEAMALIRLQRHTKKKIYIYCILQELLALEFLLKTDLN